ncbi:MAG: PLP-dependent aminotransferase family protein [Dactylosporangium sp.]|nr:PLP-dependent aminotransferase family protein [Dactylosporangium sp.]
MRELVVDVPPPIGAAGLATALRDAVTQGRLCGGTPLPSSRALAASLGVSRGVVVEAYERLVAEGRLVARRGAGTAVATSAAVAWIPPEPTPVALPRTRLPLRPGVPDLGLFPHKEWRRASDQALAVLADADLDYPDPAGCLGLRIQLCSYLGRVRAAQVEPASLAVTSGAAQAFSLLAVALRAAGVRRIGMEDPGSAAVRDHFAVCGLTVVPIPVDDEGLDVTVLSRNRVRAVFVTPAHQFPTGAVLSPRRREALIGWARRVDGFIVEDDYDAEFRYDRDPVGCVQGVAPDVTALVGSVSKVLAPALRMGWIGLPPALAEPFVAERAATDLGGPTLLQLAFAELLGSGGYDRHARRARRVYRDRRDAVVAALRRLLPEAPIEGIAAGLHLVVGLPEGVDDRRVVERAEACGLGPLALSALHAEAAHRRSGLVIGYAGHSADQLTSAIERMVTIIGKQPSGSRAAVTPR